MKRNRKVACPCCGYLTLDERGTFEICPVCFWEDDGIAEKYPNEESSANGISLDRGRANFLRIGACEEDMTKYVRPPLPEEIPANKTKRKQENCP